MWRDYTKTFPNVWHTRRTQTLEREHKDQSLPGLTWEGRQTVNTGLTGQWTTLYNLRDMLLTIRPNPKNGNTNSDYRVNSAAILYEYTTIYRAGTMAGADRREVTVRMAARTWYRAAGTPQKPNWPTITTDWDKWDDGSYQEPKASEKVFCPACVHTVKKLKTLTQHCSIVIQYTHNKTYDAG